MATVFTNNAVEVSTVQELQQAVDERQTRLVITGELVQNFRSHKRAKRILIIISLLFVIVGIALTPALDNEYYMIICVFGIILGALTLAFKGFPISVPFAFRTAGVKNAIKVMRSGKAWFSSHDTVSAIIRYK